MSTLFPGGVEAPKASRKGNAREAARGDDAMTVKVSIPTRPCPRCTAETAREGGCSDCLTLAREFDGLATRKISVAMRPAAYALDEPTRLEGEAARYADRVKAACATLLFNDELKKTAIEQASNTKFIIGSCTSCGIAFSSMLFETILANPETGKSGTDHLTFREKYEINPGSARTCDDCHRLHGLLVQFKQRRSMADRVRRARAAGIPPGEPIWFANDVIVIRTTVLNKHTCGKAPRNTVNIMRPGRWGNPFSHEKDAMAKVIVGSRDESVKMHDRWIHGEVDVPGVKAPTLDEIRTTMRGRHLLCCCKPAKCHGDNYARVCA